MRTFTFQVTVVPTNPTNAYYIIDYGDGTPQNLPMSLNKSAFQFNYTYSSSGIFNVNVTVFNKISKWSRLTQVNGYFSTL